MGRGRGLCRDSAQRVAKAAPGVGEGRGRWAAAASPTVWAVTANGRGRCLGGLSAWP